MLICRLQLTDFRSHASAVVDFAPGPNVIEGVNGAGKTNIVEAICFLSTLTSHRVATSAPLVRSGSSRAVIGAELTDSGTRYPVQVVITPGKSVSVSISGTNARPSDLIGRFRTVLFAPEDLTIVKGDPANRRSFIDQVLVQRAPRYHSVIADYERIVRQRTALLRSAVGRSHRLDRQSVLSTIGVWDDQLINVGAELLRGRLRLTDELSDPVSEAYRDLAPHSRVGFEYRAKSLAPDPDSVTPLPRETSELAEVFREAVERRRGDELDRGQTLIGPHRDDLELTVDGRPARGYASHGESWSLALSLRLGSFRVLRESDPYGGQPVLLMDDVFAELDSERRSYLAGFAANVDQCVITVAVAEDVPPNLGGSRIEVVGGSVRSISDELGLVDGNQTGDGGR